MKTFKTPKILHDVLGERQSAFEIILILIASIGIGLALYFTNPEIFARVNVLRSIIAALLIIDIFAGCIANFTIGTNNYYATKSINRIIFIAIHVHLLVIMWMLKEPITPYYIIWAYTIVGAFFVNYIKQTKYQPLISGTLLTIGLSVTPLLPTISSWGISVAAAFMIKVLYSFAVDHYSKDKDYGN